MEINLKNNYMYKKARLICKESFNILNKDHTTFHELTKNETYDIEYQEWEFDFLYEISNGMHKSYRIINEDGDVLPISSTTIRKIFYIDALETRSIKLKKLLNQVLCFQVSISY